MNIINDFLPTVEHFKVLGYLILFFISILESLAFVGFTIPGTVVIVLSGVLASQGVLGIRSVFLAVVTGVIAGEWLSFKLGQKGMELFSEKNKIFRLSYLQKTQTFFENHGAKSLLFGRFIGVFRPLMPMVAGLARVSQKKFLLLNSLGIIFWTVFYLIIGYFFGYAWPLIKKYISIFGILFACFFILFSVYYFKKNSKKNDI